MKRLFSYTGRVGVCVWGVFSVEPEKACVCLSVNVGADLLSSLGLSNDEAVARAVSR